LVREAKSGQHWAVKAALGPMLPTRSRRIDVRIELPPMTTVEEASQRIAAISDGLLTREIGMDEAQVLTQSAQAFIEAKKAADLEREVESLRETVALLMTKIENGGEIKR
jgi:hypothetical protein